MRKTFLLLMCLSLLQASAYKISNNTSGALENMRRGFVLHAVEQLKREAAVNDVAAQFYMAQCMEYGIGVNADAEAAFKMYRRAAERGFAPAMLELARCYTDGIGVAANATRAAEWQERYAKRHDGSELPLMSELYAEASQHLENATLHPGAGAAAPIAAAPAPAATPAAPAGHPKVSLPPVKDTRPAAAAPKAQEPAKSDVDVNIPATRTVNDHCFALIIANENYQDVAAVPGALNDGEIMAQYCRLTLGLPESNIHLVKDATLNNIKREINLMKKIAEAYGGDASFIIYYAGHGVPDENTRDAFLMPVDGFSADMTTCYSLNDFYQALGSMPSKRTLVLLDACFSGATRGGDMLASARGVAIKSKSAAPKGNMIVIASATADETAYPYKEQNHGLFTYYLLKKLKENRGNVTLGTLVDYVRENVAKKSIVVNGKSQTPTANASTEVGENWKNWKL